MPTAAKDHQISVRIASDTDAWLELRSGGGQLIEREQARERELLAMFNRAAEDLTPEDFAERELLLGGFPSRSLPPISA